jgi:hypothetical protein
MKEFFARFYDKNISVRTMVVKISCKFLKHGLESSPVFQEVVEHLTTSSQDLEPQVRETLIDSVSALIIKRRIARKIPEKLANCLVERLRDRKQNVRRECIQKLAKIWKENCSTYCESNLFDRIDQKWSMIPSEFLSSLRTIPSIEDQLFIEEQIDEYILGLEFDEDRSWPSSISMRSDKSNKEEALMTK